MENNHETDNNILVWPEDQMPKLSKLQTARLKFLNKWGWAFNPESRKRHREAERRRAMHKYVFDRIIARTCYEWGFFDDDEARPNRHDADNLVYEDTESLKSKLSQAEIDALEAPRRASEIKIQLDDDELKEFLEFKNLDQKPGMVTIVRPLNQAGRSELEAILALFEAMAGDKNKMLTQAEMDEILQQYAASKADKHAVASDNFGITTLTGDELANLQSDKKRNLAQEFKFDESQPCNYELDCKKLAEYRKSVPIL